MQTLLSTEIRAEDLTTMGFESHLLTEMTHHYAMGMGDEEDEG